MIKATKIKMHKGKEHSNSLTEIELIYLTGVKQDGWYTKESIYNFIISNPELSIHVDILPNPKLIAALNNNQKYVRSEPNNSTHDNLLNLPRQ